CSSVMELSRAQPTNSSSLPVLMLKPTASSATFSLKVKLGLASNLPGWSSKNETLFGIERGLASQGFFSKVAFTQRQSLCMILRCFAVCAHFAFPAGRQNAHKLQNIFPVAAGDHAQ